MTNIEIVRSPHAPNAKMPVFGVSGVGCADAEPAQPPPMGYMMPDHPDVPTPAHWFWIELGPRIRRRPRCGEIVED